MLDFQTVLRFLDAQATTPKYLGVFHIVFIALTLIAAITLCILWKKGVIKDIEKIILVTSVALLVLGLYKQILVAFDYDPVLALNYDWDEFPWNFLSIPLLVGLFIGFTPDKISKHFLSYFATFGLLAGLWGMLKPDIFVPTVGLNVYHMLCYGAFIALAILIYYSQTVRVETRTFLKGLPVFVLMVSVAISFNEVAHLIIPHHKISLFEISRHDTSITPLYSWLHNLCYSSNGMSLVEYVLCVLFYIVLVSVFALLPLLALILVKKILAVDFDAEMPHRDALALGVRQGEGLDIADTQDIFKFSGKVNSSKNAYLNTYFNNLHTNIGNNYKGSCGYVAAAMLLSYYDTILSDKIVPREFEKNSIAYNNPDFSESPGSKFYQFPFDPSEMSYKDYVRVINKAKNSYLHEMLLSIALAKNLNKEPDEDDTTDFDFASSMSTIEKTIRYYLKSVAEVKKSEYEIHIKDNSHEMQKALMLGSLVKINAYSNEIRKYAIKKVRKGYPVLLGIHNGVEGHAVIAYDYNKKEDKLYCHFGYQSEMANNKKDFRTHLTPEEEGYNFYTSALVLDFDEDKISNTHLNNYEVVVNGALFYYCPDGRYTTCDDLLVEFGPGKTELSIVGVYKKYPKDTLTIPEYYGNVRVASIGSYAFENQSHITRVVIAANIPSIPKKAFEDCESLTTIIIPASVTKIGKEAFGECSRLSNITYLGTKDQWHAIKKSSSWDRKTGNFIVHCVDGTLIKLHAEDDGDLFASNIEMSFANANDDYVAEQLAYTFNDNGRITRVNIPNTVTKIPKDAFDDCKSLSIVEIPTSVEKIGRDAFDGCKKLTTIIYLGTREQWLDIKKQRGWDDGTGEYKVNCSDGVLTKDQARGKDDYLAKECEAPSKKDNKPVEFKYDQEKLEKKAYENAYKDAYKDAKKKAANEKSSSSSAESVRYPDLGTYAFDNKGNVTHVIISTKVAKIPKKAFDDFKLLSTIIIPSSVETISNDAFDDCEKLENIIYLGTIEQWQSIKKKDDWDEDTGNYTIICLDGILHKHDSEAQSDDVEKTHLPKNMIENGRLIYTENITKKYDVDHDKDSITEVIISNKISKISRKEFKDWKSLEIIALHAGIDKIGSNAFENCLKLNNIEFTGTKEQWFAIKKGDSWDKNTGLYTVNCADGRLTKSQAQQTPVK